MAYVCWRAHIHKMWLFASHENLVFPFPLKQLEGGKSMS